MKTKIPQEKTANSVYHSSNYNQQKHILMQIMLLLKEVTSLASHHILTQVM